MHCAHPGAGGVMLSSMVSLGPPRPSQVHVFHELAHEKCEPFLEVFWIGFLEFGVFWRSGVLVVFGVWCFGSLLCAGSCVFCCFCFSVVARLSSSLFLSLSRCALRSLFNELDPHRHDFRCRACLLN